MIHRVATALLRRIEPRDAEALYAFKNDPDVANALGGFSTGYSLTDIADWMQAHSRRSDEILWTIARATDDGCIGHVGLYQIDHRIRSAEFAIMIGDAESRGRGLGKAITQFVVRYGFEMLNLNRVSLSYLETNEPARRLYESLAFRREGLLREAQYKRGRYANVALMSLLRAEATWMEPRTEQP